jgi:hypothetical protein
MRRLGGECLSRLTIGAIIVTCHACANAMPYEQEALDFVAARGGF